METETLGWRRLWRLRGGGRWREKLLDRMLSAEKGIAYTTPSEHSLNSLHPVTHSHFVNGQIYVFLRPPRPASPQSSTDWSSLIPTSEIQHFSEFLLLGIDKGDSLLNSFQFLVPFFRGCGVKIRRFLREGAGRNWKPVGCSMWEAGMAAVGMSILSPFLLPCRVFSQKPDWTSSWEKKAEQREERKTTHMVKWRKGLSIAGSHPARKLFVKGCSRYVQA